MDSRVVRSKVCHAQLCKLILDTCVVLELNLSSKCSIFIILDKSGTGQLNFGVVSKPSQSSVVIERTHESQLQYFELSTRVKQGN
jgi:hypothetical protein